MIRVAIIITRPVVLGPSIVIGSLIDSLCGTFNLDVDLYCLEEPKGDEKEIDNKWQKFNTGSFRFEEYDIIHTSGIRPDLLAFRYRKRIGFHVSTVHSLVNEEFKLTRNRLFSFFFSATWRLLLKHADKLVCVSYQVKNYYSKWFPPSQLEVIHNGISEKERVEEPDSDIRSFCERFSSKGLRVLGTAAILTRLKNTRLLLEVVASRPDLACVVIGRGKELVSLKMQAQKLAITDRCFFAGFRKEASASFRYFDLFVTASLSEGFGLTVVEAAREKVPVVCSGIPVFRELFTSGEVTFFDPRDCNSLSSAIDTALVDGSRKAEAAYIAFKTRYTEKQMGEKYYELYKSVCRNKST